MNITYLFTISCFALGSIFGMKATSLNVTSNNVFYQTSTPGKHTVAKGETVYSIAQQYGVSVADMYSANPNAADGIRIGEILIIPQKKGIVTQSADNSVKSYIVKSKETLYSIAKENGVKIEDIVAANPELNTRSLYDGQVLRMPNPNQIKAPVASALPSVKGNTKFVSHKVEAKETLYGISQQYGVTPEAILDFNTNLKDGLKIGSSIIIPVLETLTSSSVTLIDDANKISVGIVLPFVNKSDAQTARFIEYYEGFLLALEEVKSKGFSVNIYTFDMGSETGTDKLKSLLDTYEMKSLDLIIGGVSPEQVEVISEFAKKEGVKCVIPFPIKLLDRFGNNETFQVNAPHFVLYENVSSTFVNLFPSANIIYITENGVKGDRADFIEALNSKLISNGMLATSVNTGLNMKAVLASLLDADRKNIIVPTSASSKMLASILPTLNSLKEEYPNINITLFGHTDWQTYKQYTKEFSKYDTYIYTPFFFDENSKKSIEFVDKYKKWYNKSMINTYPKYAVLGYDTGLSFLFALKKYGKDFNTNLNSLSGNSLQTPFIFKKRIGADGYMNNGFYIVHYNADGNIDKTEYGR